MIPNTNVRVIGRCSICGGRVVVPVIFWSVVPPVPQCEKCGAVAAAPRLPVIPMEPAMRPAPEHSPFQRPRAVGANARWY